MSNKGKQLFPIRIFCTKCNELLYKYDKEGPGHLKKCFVDRITKDETRGDCICPNCETQFARVGQIGNRPIHTIIQGRVYKKGSCGD